MGIDLQSWVKALLCSPLVLCRLHSLAMLSNNSDLTVSRRQRNQVKYKRSDRGASWGLSAKEFACQCRRHDRPRSGKLPHAAEQISPGVTTAEPVLKNREPQGLSPQALEAALPPRRSRCEEKPARHNQSGPARSNSRKTAAETQPSQT